MKAGGKGRARFAAHFQSSNPSMFSSKLTTLAHHLHLDLGPNQEHLVYFVPYLLDRTMNRPMSSSLTYFPNYLENALELSRRVHQYLLENQNHPPSAFFNQYRAVIPLPSPPNSQATISLPTSPGHVTIKMWTCCGCQDAAIPYESLVCWRCGHRDCHNCGHIEDYRSDDGRHSDANACFHGSGQ